MKVLSASEATAPVVASIPIENNRDARYYRVYEQGLVQGLPIIVMPALPLRPDWSGHPDPSSG